MRGSCLCGAVAFEAEPADRHCHACHCEMCRKWTGCAMLAVPVSEAAIRFEGGDKIQRYRSSDWAERAFCGTCGSTLFYRLTAAPAGEGDLYLALGLFDEADALPLASEIYIDRKPASFAFAGERTRMTKAEAEARWAAS